MLRYCLSIKKNKMVIDPKNYIFSKDRFEEENKQIFLDDTVAGEIERMFVKGTVQKMYGHVLEIRKDCAVVRFFSDDYSIDYIEGIDPKELPPEDCLDKSVEVYEGILEKNKKVGRKLIYNETNSDKHCTVSLEHVCKRLDRWKKGINQKIK